MSVKVTTLIENTPGEHHGLKTEHGLSFFIEKDGHSILFDTGQSGAFIENAKQLRLDLSSLDTVVLSHGHYDHSGGLRSLAQITTEFKLFIGQGFFEDKYGYKNNFYEYLGNNFGENFLKEQGISYQFADQSLQEIVPGVYVVSQFPRKHQDEVINPRFRIMKNGSIQADTFNDEVLLAVDTADGLVVLLGCSHPGMKNMIDATVELIQRPVYAILGGTHLIEANEDSLGLSMDYFRNDALKIIGVSHCTGQVAMEQLASSNSYYYHNCTGSSLIVA